MKGKKINSQLQIKVRNFIEHLNSFGNQSEYQGEAIIKGFKNHISEEIFK